MHNPFRYDDIPPHLEKFYKNQQFEEQLFVPLSGFDMLNLVDKKANIYIYRNLKDIHSIEQLLAPHGAAIILYEWKPNFGHWTGVFQRPNSNIIEFFDPYGHKPDDQNKFINSSFQQPHYLSRLLLDAFDRGYQIEYNSFPFQTKESRDISTCGRWVALRILMKSYSLEQFADLFFKIAKVPPDYLVTRITDRLVQE